MYQDEWQSAVSRRQSTLGLSGVSGVSARFGAGIDLKQLILSGEGSDSGSSALAGCNIFGV